MSGKSDQAKGKAKQVTGIVTGDKDLEAEGRTDRLAGQAKEQVGHLKDKIVEIVDEVEGKAGEMIDKAKEALGRK
jgi:uncharacterized protein YjbJ (UPF0337 family)